MSAAPVSGQGGRGRPNPAAAARLAAVTRLYLDGVTVAEEIARRLELPPSTARRLLSQAKRELPAHPTLSGRGERTADPAGERPLSDGERASGERAPEPDRDGQPTERTLVALTRAEVTR